MQEIDLKSLTDESFEELCHALLLEKHGSDYKPVDGRGGDQGIDGHTKDQSIVYQFKFYKSRPRPAAFIRDIDKVETLPNLKSWILIIPDDPTLRLTQLIAKEKAERSFDVQVLGKTWLLALLDKYESVRKRFFDEVAKEKSVQKIVNLADYREKRAAEQHNQISKQLKNVEKKLDSKRPIRESVERHPDCLTPQHEREIRDEVKRIVKVSRGPESFDKILARLKNKYRVANWLQIRDKHFGDVMIWLNNYYHGVRVKSEAEVPNKNKLKGIIKSQQKALGLSDKQYREALMRLTGKSSTTRMDIAELEYVKDQLNILLGGNA